MLTVHVGLHKTGSTAIQSYLAKLPGGQRTGFSYLGVNKKNLLGSNGTERPKTQEQWRQLTTGILESRRHVVISDEDILGSPWGKGPMYSNALERAAEVYSAFDGLTNFQVVMYLRPQHQWFESAYTQMIQMGKVIEAEEFVSRHVASRNAMYSRLVYDLKSVLGSDRLVVRAYPQETNVVDDFLTLIEIPKVSALVKVPRINRSINPAQVELLRLMYELTDNQQGPLPARWFFQKYGSAGLLSDCSVLPEALQEKLIGLAIEDWPLLVREVEGTRLSEPGVFREIAEGLGRATIRPHIGLPIYKDEITRAAVRALLIAVPKATAWDKRPK